MSPPAETAFERDLLASSDTDQLVARAPRTIDLTAFKSPSNSWPLFRVKATARDGDFLIESLRRETGVTSRFGLWTGEGIQISRFSEGPIYCYPNSNDPHQVWIAFSSILEWGSSHVESYNFSDNTTSRGPYFKTPLIAAYLGRDSHGDLGVLQCVEDLRKVDTARKTIETRGYSHKNQTNLIPFRLGEKPTFLPRVGERDTDGFLTGEPLVESTIKGTLNKNIFRDLGGTQVEIGQEGFTLQASTTNYPKASINRLLLANFPGEGFIRVTYAYNDPITLETYKAAGETRSSYNLGDLGESKRYGGLPFFVGEKLMIPLEIGRREVATLVDPTDGKLHHVLEVHDGEVPSGIAISPSGRHCAVVIGDKLCVWSV